MHEGHRKRMSERLRSGADGLQDHELLEFLLYFALPRINTNPLAHALISAFGSLGAVFGATYDQLLAVDGVGENTAAYLYGIGNLFERIRKERTALPQMFSAASYWEFLKERFSGLTEEVIEIYCLDSAARIKFIKRYTSSNVNRAEVRSDEIARLIAMQRPHAIVVAHNHPGSRSLPSRADDKFTAELQMICNFNNVALYDHVVVGIDGPYSYFAHGKLENIKRQYDLRNFFERKEDH